MVLNECYILVFINNCEWYFNCFEVYLLCEQIDFYYVVLYGKVICFIFFEIFDLFLEDGKYWIIFLQKCILDKLKFILMLNDILDCKNVCEFVYIVYIKCYLNYSKFWFCNL